MQQFCFHSKAGSPVPDWIKKAKKHGDPVKLSSTQQEQLFLLSLYRFPGTNSQIKAISEGDLAEGRDLYQERWHGGKPESEGGTLSEFEWNAHQDQVNKYFSPAIKKAEIVKPVEPKDPIKERMAEKGIEAAADYDSVLQEAMPVSIGEETQKKITERLNKINVTAQRREQELFPVSVEAQRREQELFPVSVEAQRREQELFPVSVEAQRREQELFPVSVTAQRREQELFPVSVEAQRREQELFPVSVTAQRREQELFPVSVEAQRREQELFPVSVEAQRREQELFPVSVEAQRREQELFPVSVTAQRREQELFPVSVEAQRREQELFPVSVTAQRREQELFPVSVEAQRREQELFPEKLTNKLNERLEEITVSARRRREPEQLVPSSVIKRVNKLKDLQEEREIGFLRELAGGLSFQSADEVEAFIASQINDTSYYTEKERIKTEREKFKYYNPATALAAETLGLIPGGILSTKALSAMGVVKLPAQGAIETGVYGFNSGESPEERLILGASSAVIGGAVGKLFEKVFDPALLSSATNSGALTRLQTDALQSEVSAQKILTAPANMTDDELATQLLLRESEFLFDLIGRQGAKPDEIGNTLLRLSKFARGHGC